MNYRWGNPLVSRKWHLFESDAEHTGSFSLCGKIGFFAGHYETTEPVFGEKRGPDDCAACWRKGKEISDEELRVRGDD